jgi:hypothetical protein
MKTERVGYYYIFVVIQNSLEKPNIYKYFVVHSAVMIQSLLGSEKKPDVYDLAVADGIKEMLVMHGFTRDKILNTMVSNLAETLHIDYYVALIIYNSAKIM